MAERTVAVRLAARVDAYVAAMAKASAATTGFATTTQRSLATVGTSMQTLGRRMTLGVTVPIAALGVASTRMAMNFEDAFTQIAALTNVSIDEIDGMREAVLQLSGETAQSPQELAEALYFAASAGLDAANAMEVVEMAAQGSATGMGTTQDITRSLAAVLNAYGTSNISAAEAMDILTAAIRAGTAAPDEYAQSLGRVIPIAAQMGIGFDEVAGSIAFLTNVGLDADEAVTALRGTLLKMLAPSVAGKKTLQEMGTSFEELQAAIAQDGLLGALELLREHGFDENDQALRTLFNDNRALVGATALLADQNGQLTPILEQTANSAGALGDAFAITADTDAFKMRQALAEVQTAMITLGAILLPIAADIAGAIADVARWFADLPGPVQQLIIVLGGVAAVAGPLIAVTGSLIKNLQTIAAVSGLASTVMLGVASALALGISAYLGFTQKQRETEAATRTAVAALDLQFPSLVAAAVAAARAGDEIDGLTLANQLLSAALSESEKDVLSAMAQFNMSADDLLNVVTLYRDGGVGVAEVHRQMALSFGLTAEQAGKVANVFASMSFDEVADNASVLAAEIGITEEQLAFLTAGFFAFDVAQRSVDLEAITRQFLEGRVSAVGYKESLIEAAEQLAGAKWQDNPIAVFEALNRLYLEATDAELENAGVTADLREEAARLADQIDGTGDAVEGFGGKVEITADMIKGLAFEAEATGTKLDTMGGRAETAGDKLAGVGDKAMVGADGLRSWKEQMAILGALLDSTGSKVNPFADGVTQLDEKLAGLKGGLDDAGGGFEDFAGVAGSSIDTLTLAQEAFNDAARAAGNFGDELARLTGKEIGVADAVQEFHKWNLEFAESLEAADEAAGGFNRSLDQTTIAGQANIDIFKEQRDNILDLAQARLEDGESIDVVSQEVNTLVGQLADSAVAAGFNREEFEDLLYAWGLTPEQVETAIVQAGMLTAQQELEDLLAKYDDIPPEVATEIQTLIDNGMYDQARRRLAELSASRIARILASLPNYWSAESDLKTLARDRTAKIYVTTVSDKGKGYAEGGYISRPVFGATVGEAGPEVILPLTNPARMSALLGMPEVLGPVAAALGGLVSPGSSSGGGGATVVNQHVTMHLVNPDGPSVLRALQDLQRQRGPLPIRVAV